MKIGVIERTVNRCTVRSVREDLMALALTIVILVLVGKVILYVSLSTKAVGVVVEVRI